MLVLFLISLITFLIADIGLTEYFVDTSLSEECGGLMLISILILLGFIFLSISIIWSVDKGLTDLLIRMGAEKPQLLCKSNRGWEVKSDFNILLLREASLLTGDIESYLEKFDKIDENFLKMDMENNKECACFTDLIFCCI
jgi:hypothetical protein